MQLPDIGVSSSSSAKGPIAKKVQIQSASQSHHLHTHMPKRKHSVRYDDPTFALNRLSSNVNDDISAVLKFIEDDPEEDGIINSFGEHGNTEWNRSVRRLRNRSPGWLHRFANSIDEERDVAIPPLNKEARRMLRMAEQGWENIKMPMPKSPTPIPYLTTSELIPFNDEANQSKKCYLCHKMVPNGASLVRCHTCPIVSHIDCVVNIEDFVIKKDEEDKKEDGRRRGGDLYDKNPMRAFIAEQQVGGEEKAAAAGGLDNSRSGSGSGRGALSVRFGLHEVHTDLHSPPSVPPASAGSVAALSSQQKQQQQLQVNSPSRTALKKPAPINPRDLMSPHSILHHQHQLQQNQHHQQPLPSIGSGNGQTARIMHHQIHGNGHDNHRNGERLAPFSPMAAAAATAAAAAGGSSMFFGVGEGGEGEGEGGGGIGIGIGVGMNSPINTYQHHSPSVHSHYGDTTNLPAVKNRSNRQKYHAQKYASSSGTTPNDANANRPDGDFFHMTRPEKYHTKKGEYTAKELNWTCPFCMDDVNAHNEYVQQKRDKVVTFVRSTVSCIRVQALLRRIVRRANFTRLKRGVITLQRIFRMRKLARKNELEKINQRYLFTLRLHDISMFVANKPGKPSESRLTFPFLPAHRIGDIMSVTYEKRFGTNRPNQGKSSAEDDDSVGGSAAAAENRRSGLKSRERGDKSQRAQNEQQQQQDESISAIAVAAAAVEDQREVEIQRKNGIENIAYSRPQSPSWDAVNILTADDLLNKDQEYMNFLANGHSDSPTYSKWFTSNQPLKPGALFLTVTVEELPFIDPETGKAVDVYRSSPQQLRFEIHLKRVSKKPVFIEREMLKTMGYPRHTITRENYERIAKDYRMVKFSAARPYLLIPYVTSNVELKLTLSEVVEWPKSIVIGQTSQQVSRCVRYNRVLSFSQGLAECSRPEIPQSLDSDTKINIITRAAHYTTDSVHSYAKAKKTQQDSDLKQKQNQESRLQDYVGGAITWTSIPMALNEINETGHLMMLNQESSESAKKKCFCVLLDRTFLVYLLVRDNVKIKYNLDLRNCHVGLLAEDVIRVKFNTETVYFHALSQKEHDRWLRKLYTQSASHAEKPFASYMRLRASRQPALNNNNTSMPPGTAQLGTSENNNNNNSSTTGDGTGFSSGAGGGRLSRQQQHRNHSISSSGSGYASRHGSQRNSGSIAQHAAAAAAAAERHPLASKSSRQEIASIESEIELFITQAHKKYIEDTAMMLQPPTGSLDDNDPNRREKKKKEQEDGRSDITKMIEILTSSLAHFKPRVK